LVVVFLFFCLGGGGVTSVFHDGRHAHHLSRAPPSEATVRHSNPALPHLTSSPTGSTSINAIRSPRCPKRCLVVPRMFERKCVQFLLKALQGCPTSSTCTSSATAHTSTPLKSRPPAFFTRRAGERSTATWTRPAEAAQPVRRPRRSSVHVRVGELPHRAAQAMAAGAAIVTRRDRLRGRVGDSSLARPRGTPGATIAAGEAEAVTRSLVKRLGSAAREACG